MNKNFILMIVFGMTALVFGAVGILNQTNTRTSVPVSYRQADIVFKNTTVKADISDTNALRARGLSGRSSLHDGAGMWFVFEAEESHSIWMKEMNFPLDILWFDAGLQLVHTKENATPESFPEAFRSSAPALYVLEVPAGFVQKYQVAAGEKVAVHNLY
jgi:uncharacterized membrane protein (UPF0127 family)